MLNGKHILIENTPGLGDLIMLTPTLRKLKELYPRCRLSVVSYGNNLPLVERLTYVDDVFGIWKGRLLGRFRPAVHFPSLDWCIFTTWQPQLAMLARLLRVPHRAGVVRRGKESRCGFHHILPGDDFNSKDGQSKAAILARQVFGALEIQADIDEACDVSLPNSSEEARTEKLLAAGGIKMEGGYAAVAPFGNTSRSLPIRLVESTVRYVHEKYGIPSVLVNGKKTKEAEGLCSRLPTGWIYDASGQTTIMEMASILRNAKMVLATDSGPMHISCAFGTPTVAVFSSGNWRCYAPRRNCRIVTLDLPCSPCDRETAERCGTQACIRDITTEMVTHEIDACMNGPEVLFFPSGWEDRLSI